MMLTTHAVLGAFLAVPVVLLAPSVAPVAIVAGFVGGAFPDLDILALHRRTTPLTVAVAFFLAAAWLHSVADIVGGGAESRPWERRTERAVYDHAARRWVAPRRWVRYDGAPEDLGLVLLAAVPVTYAAPRALLPFLVASVGVSVVYAVFRRRVVPVAERVASVSLVEAADEEADKTL